MEKDSIAPSPQHGLVRYYAVSGIGERLDRVTGVDEGRDTLLLERS